MPSRVAITALASLFVAACQTPQPPYTPPPPSPEGAAIYTSHCAACHGSDGEMAAGVTHPVSIASQEFLTSVDDAFLRQTIALGRPGANGAGAKGTRMPAFAAPPDSILTSDQLDALVRHLRSWQREAPRAIAPFDASGGDAARGAEPYAAQCAACHGPDGWGDKAPRLAGATFQQTASDGWIRHVVLTGRDGKMPAFRIDDRKMADLIAFVRGLDAPPAP